MALAVLVFGWFIYPLASVVLGRRQPVARESLTLDQPVSVVLATRESPSMVTKQVAELFAQGYSSEHLEIIIAVDSAAIHPLAEYQRVLLKQRVQIVAGDAQGGKACALNAGVRAASAPYLVFADTQPRLLGNSIASLVGFLHNNKEFGGVSGSLSLSESPRERDAVLGRFWNFELAVRRAHANMHSICAVTGAIYAIRRDLWQPLPPGAICDDLFVPMRIILAGKRVGFCESARALDSRVFTRAQEFQRKVRTLTGMLQFVASEPAVLLPWRNPVWSQFVFHKLLRIATPFLAATVVVGVSTALFAAGYFALLALALVPLMLVAALALLGVGRVRQLLRDVGWLLLLLSAPVVAVWRALRGRWDVWRPQLQGPESR